MQAACMQKYVDDDSVFHLEVQWQRKLTANTHMQTFYTSLDFVRDNPGELVPEGTFRQLLDFLVQNEDNTGRHTNNPDGLPPHPD